MQKKSDTQLLPLATTPVPGQTPRKKISIIGTVGVPACYGGFETLVDNLIGSSAADISVYCSSKSYPEKLDQYKGAHLIYIPLNANGIHSIAYDIFSLIHSLFMCPDVILILGVSGCVFLPLFRMFSGSRIVTNIDGLEWQRNKWGRIAKRFLKFSEKLAVQYSDIIVSDNQAIADYLLEDYSVKSEVIAYGGDHAVTTRQNGIDLDKGYALAVCRIEPENNVEMILDAFSQTNVTIKFIGNWSNSQFGKKLTKKYAGFNNIQLIEPIYEVGILFKLRSECSFYIHGHSAGGTNPSLVEIMHFSKPILCFDCVYNRATTEDKAHFFSSVTQLIEMINHPIRDNGSEMQCIAQNRYTWEVVREKYFQVLLSDDTDLCRAA